MQVVVVTGMSGSGKSTVMDVMEDIGYYCIDNLPPQLIHRFVEICRESENKLEKIAIAADLRSGEMFADAYDCVCRLKEQSDLHVKLLYIEAQDEVIIKRYKETRRKHPLDERFNGCLHQALEFEREQLLRLKAIADYDKIEEKLKEMYEGNNNDALERKEFLPEFYQSVDYINDISNGLIYVSACVDIFIVCPLRSFIIFSYSD